jgi:hypothetical protein
VSARAEQRFGYAVIVYEGDLSPATAALTESDARLVARNNRLLFDYALATSSSYLPYAAGNIFRGVLENNQRLALLATTPIMFGMVRQAVLTAGLADHEELRVFASLIEAEAWLREDAEHG